MASGGIIVHGPSILPNNPDGQRNIIIGTSVPDAGLGIEGDIYLQYTP